MQKKDVNADKNSENVPKLESVEVVLVHCNLVKNDYQHTPKVLFSFVPSKQFGELINISPHSLTMTNTVNTQFSFGEVWFTDQASRALEINYTNYYLLTNYWVVITCLKSTSCKQCVKMRYSPEPRFRKYVKGFLSFARKFKYGKKLMDTAT